MCDSGENGDLERAVRGAWMRLVGTALPAVAACRGWSVATTPGFERLLLDTVHGAPWESRVEAPCAERADLLDLILAIEIGGRLLDGAISVSDLDRRSLALRGGAPAGACCADGPARERLDLDVARLMGRALAAQSLRRSRG